MNIYKLLYFVAGNLVIFSTVSAQQKSISGKVIDSATHVPANGVTIRLSPGDQTDITDENGRFSYKNVPAAATAITVSAVGYKKKSYLLGDFKNGQTISISPQQTQLTDVVITANTTNPYKALSEMDIKLRGVSNSQEVLRIVPGLFIGQHQGGGNLFYFRCDAMVHFRIYA